MYILLQSTLDRPTHSDTHTVTVCWPERQPLSLPPSTHTLISNLHKIVCKICRHWSHTSTRTYWARGGWPGLYKQAEGRTQTDRWMFPTAMLHWDHITFHINKEAAGQRADQHVGCNELLWTKYRRDTLNTIWGDQFEQVNGLCFRLSPARPWTCQTWVAGAHQRRVIFSASVSWPVKSAP